VRYENMENINKDNLEAIGCRTFACPNLALIDEKGKGLGLSSEILEEAKATAIEYLKKTYLRPHYSSVIHLLPSFVYIASIRNGNMIQKKRVADIFGTSSVTMNKWNKDIIDTLNIDMNENNEKSGNDGNIFENLTILSGDDVVENKSSKDKVAYNDFDIAFHHAIPDILEGIKTRGTVLVRISDVVKELGDKFERMSDVNIYMGMRHILFKYGIRVMSHTFDETDSHSERRKGLKMRMLEEGDPLPSSIKRRKTLESENFNMCFFNIDGIFVETRPDGSFIVRVSIQDRNEGIEIRDNCIEDHLSEASDVSYYSRILVKGFHKTVLRDAK
jgi:hypothetical protein